MTTRIAGGTVPIIWREIRALGDHFKDYTSGPGFDVLRLIKAYEVRCSDVDEIRVERNVAQDSAADKARQLDELRHAVDHALTCDQGTALCRDCKRLLTEAREYGR